VTAPLTVAQANAVYDILVEHAGASEEGRESFVFLQTDQHVEEYRFIGGLGFGGKFRRLRSGLIREGDLEWYVDAYPEDYRARPERLQMIGAANTALAALKQNA
jgi:hypothetical protein